MAMKNNYNEPVSAESGQKERERRREDRREGRDRRMTVRFGDLLGRRSGIDRRLTTTKSD